MLKIGGFTPKPVGMTIGGVAPAAPEPVVSDDQHEYQEWADENAKRQSAERETDEYEAWMAAQDQQLSKLAAPQKARYAHWYQGVGNTDVAVDFEVMETYTKKVPLVDDRGARARNGEMVDATYQILCADLPVPAKVVEDYGHEPFDFVNCRVFVDTYLSQIYVIEVYYGGVYVGYCRLFAPYNWSIFVADPSQTSSSTKLYPGAKTTGWVYNYLQAGVPKEQMLDPLVPWPAVNAMLHHVLNNRPDIRK